MVNCSFIFPIFVFDNGENSVTNSPRVIASTVINIQKKFCFSQFSEFVVKNFIFWQLKASGNIWLQRSAPLFQLKYKKELDTLLLGEIINQLLGSKEFFINKAIGWILREYSKTNPHWVIEFANKTSLNPLSRREALRLLK